MRRIFGIAALLAIVLVAPAFSQNAVVKEVTGQVQLLSPGGSWTNAAVGSLVTQGTVVSTGFGSSAVLDLGTSQVQVKQLTRMRLDELLRTQSTATTSLFLTVGEVHANVDNSLSITQKFTLKSPVSTAAVRGTIFDFGPYQLTVDRGLVHFSNEYGLGREVSVGESSSWNGPYVPGSAEAFAAAKASTNPSTNAGGEGSENGPTVDSSTGSLAVTVTVGN
ncbi:MAG TPA: hypothetical protein VMW69_09755 [Spirochaetia bacterium]|nr:hypothetical protein [Spirochaetia bacterium]